MSLFRKPRSISPSLPDLLNQLDQLHTQNTNRKRLELLAERKRILRLKRSMASYQIENPKLKFDNSIKQFSVEKSIDDNCPFLQYDKRRNLIVPDRIFESKPNMRVNPTGNFNNKIREEEDSLVVSRKFEEFCRIVDNQSGVLKKKACTDKLKKNKSGLKISLKKTFFSKPNGDQFNFYPLSDKNTKSSSRLNLFQLTEIRKMSSIKLKHTIETNLTQQVSERRDSNIDNYQYSREKRRLN